MLAHSHYSCPGVPSHEYTFMYPNNESGCIFAIMSQSSVGRERLSEMR